MGKRIIERYTSPEDLKDYPYICFIVGGFVGEPVKYFKLDNIKGARTYAKKLLKTELYKTYTNVSIHIEPRTELIRGCIAE